MIVFQAERQVRVPPTKHTLTTLTLLTVFELLKPYTCLGATKDSSARHPPPRCHPGTRERIRERHMRWLVNEYDEWKMLWVRGFAGTCKSAVAQSFADSCEEEGILGGAYFFFRAAGMNKSSTVVPTLIYQLASNVNDYQSLIERRLAQNPSLLENSPPVQFRKLIIEPLRLTFSIFIPTVVSMTWKNVWKLFLTLVRRLAFWFFVTNMGCLPGLTWASDSSNQQPLSRSIMNFIQTNVFSESFPALLNRDENLLAQALNINFRYWPAHHVSHFARICQLVRDCHSFWAFFQC
jgi:hypothetical protein